MTLVTDHKSALCVGMNPDPLSREFVTDLVTIWVLRKELENRGQQAQERCPGTAGSHSPALKDGSLVVAERCSNDSEK